MANGLYSPLTKNLRSISRGTVCEEKKERDKFSSETLLEQIVSNQCQHHQQDECDEYAVNDPVSLPCLLCFAGTRLQLFLLIHGILIFRA